MAKRLMIALKAQNKRAAIFAAIFAAGLGSAVACQNHAEPKLHASSEHDNIFLTKKSDEKNRVQQSHDKPENTPDPKNTQKITESATDEKYMANLPCADCSGIKATLVLHADGSFTRTDRYGDDEREFIERGKFTDENGIITTHSEHGEIARYKRDGENLLMLGADDVPPADEFKAAYTFMRR